MSKEKAVSVMRMLVTATSLYALSAASVYAAQIRVEASISTKTESRLEFADGSKRYILAVQREGKATGSAPLAGATMLEWGTHDVVPGVGVSGSGYLVFTAAEGDIAYLKYQFRNTPIPRQDGKPRNLINGTWEVVGSAGKLKQLQGAGVLRVNVISPNERLWILEGELVQAP
ncbi:MAG: hypothetical protein ABIO63_11870 [Casimicrobiaceae bacterium]